MNPTAATLTAEIKAECARQGKSLADLADAIGISPSQMSRRATGKLDFTARELLAIADVLGVPLSVLVERAGAVAA